MTGSRLRPRLFHGTALAAALLAVPQTARAADPLPSGGTIQLGTINATTNGVTPTAIPGGIAGSAISADIAAPAVTFALPTGTTSAIVNWTNFNIDAGKTVTFKQDAGAAFSVLNRISGPAVTTIAGTLQGDGGVAAANRGTIWVINESGLTFGGSAVVTNLTGLVASSLGVTDAAYALATTTGTQFTGSGIAPITIEAGASIAPGATLLLVAPKLLLTGGTLTATSGDAGFVVASDATVKLSANGIVNVHISAGTDFAAASGSVIAASVNGKRVLVAAASTADITDALLNVSGSLTATTATATDQGIVLAVGRDVSLGGADAIDFTPHAVLPIDPPGAQFNAAAVVTGPITSGGAITASAGGALSIRDATAAGDTDLRSAAGTLTLDGNLSAGGRLVAIGQGGVVLGRAAVASTLAAHDDVSVGSPAGIVTAAGATTLMSNKDGTDATKGVLLSSTGAIGDATNPGLIGLTGGTAASRAPVTVVSGITGDVNLGAVTGSKLASLAGSDLITANSVTIAAIDVSAPLTVTALAGNATVGSITTGGSATVSAPLGTATVGGAVAVTGSYTVTGAAVLLGNASAAPVDQSATGAVLIKATGAGGIAALGTLALASNSDGDASVEALTLDSAGAITGGASLTGGTAANRSAVQIHLGDPTAPITLGAVAGSVLRGVDATYLLSDGTFATDGDITLGAVTTTQGLTIATSNGAVSTGLLTSTAGDVVVAALGTAGTLDVAGASATAATRSVSLTALNDVAITGDIASATTVTVTSTAGNAAMLGATGTTIALTATGGAAKAAGAVTATGDYTVRGASAVIGATNATLAQKATGDVLVVASGIGGIVAKGAVTLTADSAGAGNRTLVLDSGGGIVTGGAAGDVGINLVAGSGAVASAANRSDVRIRLGDPAAAIVLGSVDAETVALAAAGPAYVPIVADTLLTSGNVTFGSVATIAATTIGSTLGDVVVGGATSKAGGVTLRADAGALTTGAIGAAEGVTLTGGTSLAATGSITAGVVDLTSGISATAPALTLGTTNTIAALTAPGAITLTRSGTGAFTIRGAYSITSGSAVALVDTDLSGASVSQDDSLALSGTAVTNGAITSTPAALFAGNGDVSLIASAGNVNAGSVAARGAVTVTATGGNATIGGAVSGNAGATTHAVTVTAASGTATVGGDVAATGDYNVTARSVTLGGEASATLQTSGGNALVKATIGGIANGTGTLTLAAQGNAGLAADGAIAFTTVRAGGTATVGGFTGLDAASIAGSTVRANGAVALNASGPITLAAGGSVATERKLIDADLGGFGGAPTAPDANVKLVSSGGLVSVGAIQSTGSATITAASAATVAGNVTAGFGGGSGDYRVTGTSVALGNAGGAVQQASGGVTVRATAGGIAVTGPLALASNTDGAGGERLILDVATGVDASNAITGSPSLTGGTGSDVGIRLGDTSRAVTLGTVAGARFGNVDYVGGNPALGYAPVDAAFLTTGAIGTGAVTTTQGIDIRSTAGNVSTGVLTSTAGAVTASSSAILTVAGASSATNFDVALTSAGDLVANGTIASGRDLTLTSTGGSATLTNATVARNVSVNAGTLATVAGGLTVPGDYSVTGASVILGDGTAVTQAATGTVTITATGGTLTGNAGLTLQSNSNGVGAEPLTLRTSGASGGDIDFTGTTLLGGPLLGGPATQSVVVIDSRTAANGVSLGNVVAQALQGSVAGAGLIDGLSRTSALVVGDVAVLQNLTLDTGGTLTAGSLSAPSIALSSTGLLSAASITATAGPLVVTGTGGVTATGVVGAAGAAGDILVDRNGALAFAALSAARNVTIGLTTQPTTVAVAGTTHAGGDLLVKSSGSQSYSGAITAGGAATLTSSGGTLALGTLTASNAALLGGTAITATALEGSAVTASATGGNATIATITTTAGDALVTATGTPTATATVSGAVTSAGGYGVTGRDVVLGAASQQAAGAVTIEATGGTLSATSGLTLLANSDGIGGEALTLATSGATGGDIAAAGTTLGGGPARQSLLQIRSRDAANTVTLGTVDALGLTGATGIDPFTPGLTRTGAITVGDVTLTQALSLTTGGVLTGGILTGASVTLVAAGNITVGALTGTAGAVSATSGATLTVPSATSAIGFDVSLTSATDLTVPGTVSSGRDINITSTGGNATLTTATASTPGSIRVTAAPGAAFTATLIDGIAGDDITLSGGNVAVTTQAIAGDDIVLKASAGTVTASGLSATGAGSDSEGDSDVVGTLGLAGLARSNIVAQGTGDVTLNGTTRASRDLVLTSTGGAVRLADGAAARDLTIDASGLAGITLARAGNALVVDGASVGGFGGVGVGTATLEAGVSVAATAASGDLSLTSARTTGTLLLADFSGFGAVATATFGDVTATASGNAILASGRSVRDLTLTSTGGDAILTDGGTFVDGGPVPLRGVTRDIGVIALGTATITTATAGGGITAEGATASTIDRAYAGGSIVASGGVAHVGTGVAGGSITASGSIADIASGDAGADIVATAGGSATITSGTAAGVVRADSTGGIAHIVAGASTGGGEVSARTLGTALASIDSATTAGSIKVTSAGAAEVTAVTAGSSVIVKGATATVVTQATAGDDIILVGSGGAASASALTVTGAGSDIAATDGYGNAIADPLGGPALTGLGGSNIIVRATGAAIVTGAVSVAQADPLASADYRVGGATVTLGTAGGPLAQGAAGAVSLTATSGDVILAGTGGSLEANVGGARNAAAGALAIAAAAGVSGTTIAVIANRAVSTAQSDAPGVTIAAAATGGGAIDLASVRGGPVTITAPTTITVPLITASGDVSIRGVAAAGFDTATIAPLTIGVDGQGIAGFAPVSVTIAGGAGAEVTGIGVANGGLVGAFQLASNTGAATLRGAPVLPASIGSILVESQTGVASIVNPSNTNAFAAGSIALRGRQAGSSAIGAGLLHATGDIIVTGATATLGNALSDAGTILVAATGAASLATGAFETATATTGSLTVSSSGGAATLGVGVAGGTIAVRGATVTVGGSATAGDDILLLGDAAVITTGATLATTAGSDAEAGSETATHAIGAIGSAVGGSIYAPAGPATILVDTSGDAVGTVAGTAVRQLGGSNIVVTSGATVDLGTVAAARDLRVEAGGNTLAATPSVTLGTTTAGRDLLVADGLIRDGGIVAVGTISAGDDLVLTTARGSIDLGGATLTTTGGTGLTAALRADGTTLANPLGGAGITDLGGSNIALAASGVITLGTVATTGGTPSSLRAFAGGSLSTTAALTATGSIVLVGSDVTVAPAHSLTAGNDIVVAARSGAASVGSVLTTTGAAASDTPLAGLSGEAVTLADATALGAVEGSSIVVAANGSTTVPATVTSAGRLTIIGRGGVSLGTGAAATQQRAARDVLVEASIGVAPAAASVTLADGMTLASNSDGVGAGDNLVVRLGNGSLAAGTATLRAGRSAAASLADQGIVAVAAAATDGVKSIAIATLDSASSTLRAFNDVTVTDADVDAGLVMASKAGAASLTTLTIGTAVPLMTAAESAAIDIGVFGATGATLGTVGGAALARDITVATANGNASITGTAAARDDIVVASTTGTAFADLLTTAGAPADSETTSLDPVRDADGVALADPYMLYGPAISGMAGRNIVVAGGTGATLNSVVVPVGNSIDGVRVLAASGPATLATLASNGSTVARVTVGTRAGTATATAINQAGDLTVAGTTAVLTQGEALGVIRVDAGAGGALVGDARAGYDLIVTSDGTADVATATAQLHDASIAAAGAVTLGRLTAGNDVVISAGSATLGLGTTGLVAARRNLAITSPGAVTIGTARAGGTLGLTAASLAATTLEAGDALTATATAGDATVTTATSTGLPLLADFTGFAATGSAAGASRDVGIGATGVATLATGTAVRSISVAGSTATVTTAFANTGGTDGDLAVIGGAGGATLGTGMGRDIRVAATAGGAATATAATATRDLLVDASGGIATLTTGSAGRDAVVVGPAVVVGSLDAGDDIAVAATGGALTAATLTLTGANAADAVDGLVRADGTALADPVAGGPVAGVANGGTVLALATGDVSVGTVTATAASGAVLPGLIRLAALGALQVTDASATAGDIAVAGTSVDATTLSAGRDIGGTATGGALTIATIATARDVTLQAATDVLIGNTASLGRDLAITAGRDIGVAADATPAAIGLAVGGTATLTSGRDLAVLRRITTGGALTAGAGSALSLASFGAGGAATLTAPGGIVIAGDSVATGALVATSSGGAISAAALTGGGMTLTAANAIDVNGPATSTGALSADGGTLGFGSIAAAQDVTLRSRGTLSSGATAAGTTLAATADAGALTLGATTSGGNATITATAGTAELASLASGGTATLRAAQALDVTGAATSAGGFAATSDAASLTLGSIAAGGAATLRGATGVTVSGGTTAGGAVVATAKTGNVTTGDIASGGDVALTATAGAVVAASVTKASKLTIAAATNATVSGAVVASGDTSVTATTGSATLASSVTTANYTIKASNGTIALGGAGGIQRSSGTATFDSQRLTLGTGATLVANTRIQLNVTGTAPNVALGGAAANPATYALSKADLRKFQTPTLEISAGARNVDFGDTDLDAVTPVGGGFAGISGAFGVRTTGDIRVADTLRFSTPAGTTTPRVLTLGGAAGGADLDKTTPTAASVRVLARSTLDNGATGTGGQILAGGSTVQLRATYIALGEAPLPDVGRPFIDDLLPPGGTPLDTPVVRSQFLNNAGSTFYTALPGYANQTPAPQTLVRSGTLVLAAGKWALIQNTGVGAQPGGGIDVTTFQLNRLGGAAAPDPVIGVFGGIGGKTGIVAAISVSADQLDGISPNNIRINGCVALSTGGCIQSSVLIPLINLSDPARALLISSAPDLALSIELITGATNEALWREDDDDPAQNRPQRDSRP